MASVVSGTVEQETSSVPAPREPAGYTGPDGALMHGWSVGGQMGIILWLLHRLCNACLYVPGGRFARSAPSVVPDPFRRKETTRTYGS